MGRDALTSDPTKYPPLDCELLRRMVKDARHDSALAIEKLCIEVYTTRMKLDEAHTALAYARWMERQKGGSK